MKVNGQLLASAVLPSEDLYTLDMRLGEPQSWSGRCGEKYNLFPLPRIELYVHVAIPTELSRLPHSNDNMTHLLPW
jgi:hypothetical protein